jgi:SsrA-binding protein
MALGMAWWPGSAFLLPIAKVIPLSLFLPRTYFASILPWSSHAMSRTRNNEARDEGIKVICQNRRAFHEYTISERLECGIVLTGTEIKSLREGASSLDDAYAKVEKGEVWLLGSEIPEYSMAHRMNHKPKRPRKLLLHRREIAKFAGKASQRGFTLIPLRLYFRKGRAKVELGVARGKQLFDKRESLRRADHERDMRRALSRKHK